MPATIVLDTSAIINGLKPEYESAKFITLPVVLDELQERKDWLHLAFETDKIEMRQANSGFVDKVNDAVDATADTLSVADIFLLALALEHSAAIATDDYGIQNVAKVLGIEFIPVGESGIKKVISWQYYCPACKRKYSKNKKVCEVCGSALKRKPA